MEKILEIKEVDNEDGYSGYTVSTTKQEIRLLIADQRQCCEHWGYFWTNDNVDEFIGSELLSIRIVDNCLKEEKMRAISEGVDEYEGCAIFVNLETSKGTLQFTVYNDHNGYYAHEVKITSIQLTHESWI